MACQVELCFSAISDTNLRTTGQESGKAAGGEETSFWWQGNKVVFGNKPTTVERIMETPMGAQQETSL